MGDGPWDVGLMGGRRSMFAYLMPVSYTHLDVYKRQGEEVGMKGKLKISFIGDFRRVR